MHLLPQVNPVGVEELKSHHVQAIVVLSGGVSHIALVTHAWLMPRSIRQFEAAGFDVVPAPMGYIRSDHSLLLQWLPSGKGLRDSGWVIHEWLGLLLT